MRTREHSRCKIESMESAMRKEGPESADWSAGGVRDRGARHSAPGRMGAEKVEVSR